MKQISPKGRTARRNTLPLKRTVLWAARSFHGALGLYVGIAFEAGQLSVALTTAAGLRWVPARDALTDAEAQIWASTGFRRSAPRA
ncbi:hypothetical protein [Paraburkholderia sp. J8-2]|uniref:hypothetical protein n=1 Tax=Paraburkholderia sp. J8-2 TaxID=2805440 RepID=UPI002AB7739E|nr:hypothetical protein [Paraburkholderia sp. J8-2]